MALEGLFLAISVSSQKNEISETVFGLFLSAGKSISVDSFFTEDVDFQRIPWKMSSQNPSCSRWELNPLIFHRAKFLYKSGFPNLGDCFRGQKQRRRRKKVGPLRHTSHHVICRNVARFYVCMVFLAKRCITRSNYWLTPNRQYGNSLYPCLMVPMRSSNCIQHGGRFSFSGNGSRLVCFVLTCTDGLRECWGTH